MECYDEVESADLNETPLHEDEQDWDTSEMCLSPGMSESYVDSLSIPMTSDWGNSQAQPRSGTDTASSLINCLSSDSLDEDSDSLDEE